MRIALLVVSSALCAAFVGCETDAPSTTEQATSEQAVTERGTPDQGSSVAQSDPVAAVTATQQEARTPASDPQQDEGAGTSPDPPQYPEPDEFRPFVSDFDQPSLSEDWDALQGLVATADANLVLQAGTNAAATVNIRRIWKHPLRIELKYVKNRRWSDVLLPGGYFVRFGGRGKDLEGGHKYGTNVSLYHDDAEVEAIVSHRFVPGGEQSLEVQLQPGAIRVYCQKLDDNKYLHADGSWRPKRGPCIIHPINNERVPSGILGIRGHVAGQNHHFRSVAITEPTAIDDDAFFGPAAPVPSLAEDGLTFPTIKHLPMGWAGYAPRVDSERVDDPSIIPYTSFVHWGSPKGASTSQIKSVNQDIAVPAYMIISTWGSMDAWKTWVAHAKSIGIDPDVGKVGPLIPETFAGGTNVAWTNLANEHVREFKLAQAKAVAASPHNDGILFDVTHPGMPEGYFTRIEWEDLQGTLYRQIWKEALQPRGKLPIVNVGHSKTDRNKRICEWIPIIYQDRQINGGRLAADWEWHEWTVQINPRYRQEVFGNEWISIMDGLGEDARCLNEDIKYGWLTTYYQRLATLGGFAGRHFLAGGFNGDWKRSGKSGRSEWGKRHWVPAMLFDIGQPVGTVEQVEEGVGEFEGGGWSWRLYRARFENADVYHFPNYLRSSDYESPDPATAPPRVIQFDEPHDVLQFDGTWLANQSSVTIPAGSGRIVRPTQQ